MGFDVDVPDLFACAFGLFFLETIKMDCVLRNYAVELASAFGGRSA